MSSNNNIIPDWLELMIGLQYSFLPTKINVFTYREGIPHEKKIS